MKTLLIFIFTIISFVSYSQQMKLKYANELYETFAYMEASQVYEEMYHKGKLQDNNSIINMAESFYLTRNYEKAYEYYRTIYENESLTEKHFNYYLDCLLRLDKIDYIELLFKDSNKKDDYGVYIKNIKKHREELSKKSFRYKLNEWPYNSQKGDFSSHVYKGDVFISSNRNDIGYTHKEYAWDQLNFANIYKVDSSGNIKIFDQAISKYHDGPIYFNEALGKVYLTRTEYNKNNNDKKVKLYESLIKTDEKNNIVLDWQPMEINGDYNIGHVSFNTDNTKMYFSSDMPGGKGGTDIYYSDYKNNKWSSPVNMEEVNTSGDEMFPTFHDDVLYFSSNGLYGFGGLDVYKYEIDSETKPENLGLGVNSSMDDFSFTHLDKNKFLLTSDRNTGYDKIYLVEKQKVDGLLHIIPKKSFKDIVINEDVELWLINRKNNDNTIISKDKEGYIVSIESDNDYIVSGRIKNYELSAPIYLNTDRITNNEKIEKDIYFDQMKYDILVKTISKETGEPLAFVEGEFTDPGTGQKTKYKTDSEGKIYVNIDNNTTYKVSATKKGFLDLDELIHSNGDVLLELDMKMIKIKENQKFEIENILYDLDKWDLRDSSKIELDKLAAFLIKNDNIKVELSSHTDSRGSDRYNQTLSQRRAQSCVSYLIDKGVNENHIIAKGYGESQLVNKCSNGVKCSEQEHQGNRRTEIKILNVT